MNKISIISNDNLTGLEKYLCSLSEETLKELNSLEPLARLLTSLSIKYNDESYKLYQTAITHSSSGYELFEKNNERLEFLGDAVLELITSDYLFHKEEIEPGKMTTYRACFVRNTSLAKVAVNIGLDKCIRVGKSISKISESIIADAFEAFLGAIYLQEGFNFVYHILFDLILPADPYSLFTAQFDHKTLLQQYCQAEKIVLEYNLDSANGPSNDKLFSVTVFVDHKPLGSGVGKTQKMAEENAAKIALNLLNDIK